MRLLLTFVGGSGHLDPLLPVARRGGRRGARGRHRRSGGQMARVTPPGLRALPTSHPSAPPEAGGDRSRPGPSSGATPRSSSPRTSPARPPAGTSWSRWQIRGGVPTSWCATRPTSGPPWSPSWPASLRHAADPGRRHAPATPADHSATGGDPAEHGLAPDPYLARCQGPGPVAVPPSFRDPSVPLSPSRLLYRPRQLAPGGERPAPLRHPRDRLQHRLRRPVRPADRRPGRRTRRRAGHRRPTVDPAVFGPQPRPRPIEQFVPRPTCCRGARWWSRTAARAA